MKTLDLLLIHPPSYQYFREEKRAFGPVSDVVPSSPVFDMYPYGFLSIATYLIKRGYSVGIHNAAALMILNESYSFSDYIKSSDSLLYGIDLHWLVHAHGAIESARIIKELNPNAKIALGGFSATIFHREIMEKYPWIDYVILGDTSEPIFEKLIRHISGRGEKIEDIPNLAYRHNGTVKVNALNHAYSNLDEFGVDYDALLNHVISSSDPVGFIPFANFITDPIGAVISFKGCRYSCVTCGGSNYTFKKYLGRGELGKKSLKTVMNEVATMQEYMKIPVFFIGDMSFMGMNFAENLVRELNDSKIDSGVFFEFFRPPSIELLKILDNLKTDVYLQISPETHNEHVRARFGRPYSNKQLEDFIRSTVSMHFSRLDLYFMIGLPEQTFEDSTMLPQYIRHILSDVVGKKNARKIDYFVAPLAPFVDPGSLVFNYPERFGYNLETRSFEGHYSLIKNNRDWRYMLNYSTRYMSKDDIAKSTYQNAKEVIRLKASFGLIGEETSRKIIERIDSAYSDKSIELDNKETVDINDLYPHTNLIEAVMARKKGSEILMSIINSIFSA